MCRTAASASSAGVTRGFGRGNTATRARARAVREELAAATLVDGEPAAGVMTAAANFAGLEAILLALTAFRAMPLDEGLTSMRSFASLLTCSWLAAISALSRT